jgi:hypothetical protein
MTVEYPLEVIQGFVRDADAVKDERDRLAARVKELEATPDTTDDREALAGRLRAAGKVIHVPTFDGAPEECVVGSLDKVLDAILAPLPERGEG